VLIGQQLAAFYAWCRFISSLTPAFLGRQVESAISEVLEAYDFGMEHDRQLRQGCYPSRVVVAEVARPFYGTRIRMTKFRFLVGVVAVGAACVGLAQNRMAFPVVSQDSGHAALGVALRKLSVSATFLQAPAHPDDETNALFALFGYGQGMRVIDVQNNRGDGGQNEIGPELFRDIAVLRTSELLSAHRIDGAEQYFTRAIDYGYSFDPQEVIGKWGEKDIVGDYARLFRMLRPDVVVTMNIQGRGGDRAHEATTVLVHEGFLAAGDPAKYPEQIAEGLRPWKPAKLYFAAPPAPPAENGGRGGRGGRGGDAAAAGPALTPVNFAAYDSLLCRSYQEISNDARSNHKCQGIGGLPPLPGVVGGRGGGRGGAAGYQLMETTLAGQKGKAEQSLFEGIDTSLMSIARFAGTNPPTALTSGLQAILADAKRAQDLFAKGDEAGTAAPIEDGLTKLWALRDSVAGMPISDDAKYEVKFRLDLKEKDYQDALIAAHGLTFDAVADDGLVIAGQAVKVTAVVQNHGASDVGVTSVAIAGLTSPGVCKIDAVRKDNSANCAVDAKIPLDAKATTPYFTDNYWKHPENQAIQILDPSVPFGVPFAPTPFRVTFFLKLGNVEVKREVPVTFRYIKDIYFGDKRMELNVVPAFSVSMDRGLAVIPAPAAGKGASYEVNVSVVNGNKGAAEANVALALPDGWKATPAKSTLTFAHEDEALSARFVVAAPAGVKQGSYSVRADVTSAALAGQTFASGYQEIEYPHIQRRQVMKPAETVVKVVDVKTVPDVKVGYIVGVGDQVPPALEQIGAKISMIGTGELASGDLSKYDVIMTGVRAYERRDDLRAYNQRLLDYANRGGTVIVQYNKMEFNQAQYGPWPAKVSANRITDENAPVKLLAPDDRVFQYPNHIGDKTWANWVQERGLYFLGEKDAKYRDLIAMTDPFKDNPGEKLGSFVEATTGKGRWIYLGLGLWRQLPAGTEGAYQLLANLVALGKAPPAPGGKAPQTQALRGAAAAR
jgi:LmbE family N-acetylglucosaminyl deacetylase